MKTGRPPVHGKTGTPEFNAWQAMHARCSNLRCKSYKNYGGRGIKVCRHWATFENFLDDVGERPSAKHSLERKDNAGDYVPSNCVWATAQEQANNRRSNVWLTCEGRTQTLQQWADELGTTHTTLYMRLRRGWTVEKALTYPVKQYKERKA